MLLLGLGLSVVSAGVVVLASVSNSSMVVATRELRRYSTSTYDILVRPAGARSAVEEAHDLVEANHLSGIAGGISFAQYEAIRAIPGVEVAAPVAMLGYVPLFVQADPVMTLSQRGLYVLEEELITRDGARVYEGPNFTRRTYFYFDLGAEPTTLSMISGSVMVNWTEPVRGFYAFEFLLAGIDPLGEAKLVGLDQAVEQGRYLQVDEPLNRRGYARMEFNEPLALVDVPVLINVSPYLDMTLRSSVRRVAVDLGSSQLTSALTRMDYDYLGGLPRETLAATETSGEHAFANLVANLMEASRASVGSSPTNVPSPVIYEEAALPVEYDGITLALKAPGGLSYMGFTPYRPLVGPTGETTFDSAFAIVGKGVFDIERIPRPPEMIAVPLETYFPPRVVLRFDEHGRRVDPPASLLPTPDPTGYIQPPPLLLTTLEAARALRGEDAISAIRVRVAGVDELTPANQRKIESVASAIEELTGLTVDIMTGSSPTRVLVHVPEIGYVEELWIQKGANLVYQDRIQAGSWLLLAVLLAVSGVFTLDLTWADVFARQRTIGLQKALGWSSRTVLRDVVRQFAVTCALATLVGTLAGIEFVRRGGWVLPPRGILVGAPLVVVLVAILGGLYPALQAARISPILVIQSAGVSHGGVRFARSWRGLWGHAARGLLRALRRSLLATLMAAASGALLVVMGGVLAGREGMLGATLLGEFILVRIGPMHFVIVLAGLLLTVLSAGNALHARVVEQTREVGALKALGWRSIDVGRLFVRQGLLIGAMGGVAGTMVGLGSYLLMNRELPPIVALVGLLSLCIVSLVGMLSSLYPAAVAARVPPGVALRHE